MHTEFLDEIEYLKTSGLFRSLRLVESEHAPEIVLNGKKVLIFCSNNYLGFANHPELKRAGIEAIEKYGTSSVASRLVSGNMTLHEELEERIARFKGTECALLFNSGYHANTGVIPALADRGDLILSDELNHATIIDGCRLSRAEVVVYPHRDTTFVEDILRKSRHLRKLIVTDGVFSMDGDIAPLRELVFLKDKYNAILMVDEAHATGVVGNNGRGITDELNVTESVDIIMGTLGKALGSYGAFVATNRIIKDYLINKARSLIFSTSLPPSICAVSIRAIELLENSPEIIEKLHANVKHVKSGLKSMFPGIPDNMIPIIPLITGEEKLTMQITEKLLEEGIFVQGIRPPSVPPGTSRLRVTIMATHTKEQLDRLISAIHKICETLIIHRKSL